MGLLHVRKVFKFFVLKVEAGRAPNRSGQFRSPVWPELIFFFRSVQVRLPVITRPELVTWKWPGWFRLSISLPENQSGYLSVIHGRCLQYFMGQHCPCPDFPYSLSMSDKMSVIVCCHVDLSTNFGNSLGYFSCPRQIFLYKEVFLHPNLFVFASFGCLWLCQVFLVSSRLFVLTQMEYT